MVSLTWVVVPSIRSAAAHTCPFDVVLVDLGRRHEGVISVQLVLGRCCTGEFPLSGRRIHFDPRVIRRWGPQAGFFLSPVASTARPTFLVNDELSSWSSRPKSHGGAGRARNDDDQIMSSCAVVPAGVTGGRKQSLFSAFPCHLDASAGQQKPRGFGGIEPYG